MSERTGGHYLDTGEGPKRISVMAGNAIEAAANTAYRAYLDHRPGCVQCQTSLFICDVGEALWEAYKEARRETC